MADKPRRVLKEEGAEAAVEWFDKDKWANAPEYVRPRQGATGRFRYITYRAER